MYDIVEVSIVIYWDNKNRNKTQNPKKKSDAFIFNREGHQYIINKKFILKSQGQVYKIVLYHLTLHNSNKTKQK